MNPRSSSRLHDVVVAGAGPVGLFLACELALAGVDVLVLERDERPEAPLNSAPLGLRGLSVATSEALDRRGLLDDLLDAVPRPAQAGHFAGIAIDAAKVDPSAWPWRAAGPALTTLASDIATLEAVLAARAFELGVVIRRGLGVTGLDERDDELAVHANDLAFRTRWLVGCDGGRSTVRKLAGFEFAGTEPEFTAYSALVDIADPAVLKPGRHATPRGFIMSQPGRIAIADFDGGAHDREQPVTRAHLQAVLRRVSGTEVRLTTLHQATTFTDRARLATTYRRGRVLLAGDAAHVHSALGGQGLNAGLGDAMNLGWKLAATVRGRAPDDLLDTYEAERRPVGQWLLDWSRAQVAIMRPGPQARAMEGIVRELAATRDGATWFAGQLWGVTLRHDLGGGHPMTGRSAPDLAFDDGRRLASWLREGRGVLVDLAGSQRLRQAAARWGERVRVVGGGVGKALGLAALLVRPDGVVAWASDDDAASTSELEGALTRWFGPAARATR
ncbi:FAD-dependent monooxygenase [Scleromatobacter humisilvae]|uniref:FAD-dependent monooxygenase n=1 Tax=Scleromatobacter humisilvae TaxID=2897159 RepID=A0A9X2BYM3_9BURK|nr:FAD-dependent monooxygenase [Scleromatobacter humisilvae]MCK9684346.1 FAD-dependent monooxygenase [Scleromatobacter humisilvae]